MAHRQRLRATPRSFVTCIVIFTAILLLGSTSAAQDKTPSKPDMPQWLLDLQKDPALSAEIGKLFVKMQAGVQFPLPRKSSRVLPLLPESTMFYMAIPNYGDTEQQALAIFQKELAESPELCAWWQRGDLATVGPKIEEFLRDLAEFSHFLGDELVISGSLEGREPKPLIVAEIRKPGLKQFLEEVIGKHGGKPPVRIFDLPGLAAVVSASTQDVLILVRPDFVVAATDLPTLRKFNARLDRGAKEFASAPFGRRIAQSYEGGMTTVIAADLQEPLQQIPFTKPQDRAIFHRTGFSDLKYVVMDHRTVEGHSITESEITFTGPRRGIASWLGAPAPLGSLEFVSPKAMIVSSILLKSPAQIFDDVMDLVTAGNPNAPASLAQVEQMINVNLKPDLFSQLGGEITLELDDIDLAKTQAVWKAMLRVNDSKRLQQTLGVLLALAHVVPEWSENGGVSYYTLHIPTKTKPFEISYTYAEGYLIAGSSRDAVADALRLHHDGESLAKSKKFQAALPPGHPSGESTLIYEDPVSIAQLQLRLKAPDLATPLGQLSGSIPPIVACSYGEESAIRGESTSMALDAGMLAGVAIVAAVAIPNLLRSRMAANEASAVGTVRTVLVAEVTYNSAYPERGYATELSKLGLDPRGPQFQSADHASLIDDVLGNSTCTKGAWCTKSGYRFNLRAVCKARKCAEFVVTAAPVESGTTGTRSFCATSDGVVRSNSSTPPTAPLSPSECRAWTPLQ
jgi:type IV pilus assembly protein PilA